MVEMQDETPKWTENRWWIALANLTIEGMEEKEIG